MKRTNVNTSNLRLEALDRYMRREGLSGGTRQKYAGHVEHFLDWLGERHPRDLTRAERADYLDTFYADGRDPAPSTFRLHKAAVDKFYDYLEERGDLDDENGVPRRPFDRVKLPTRRQKPNDHLRAEELDRLLNASLPAEERIVVQVLARTGMRISEALSLTLRDVDLQSKTIHVRRSKTDSGLREIPICPKLETELRIWIERLRERHGDIGPSFPLLAGRSGKPISSQYADRLVKRAAEAAGVRVVDATDKAGHHRSSVTAHTLRRTFGSDLINKGMRGVGKWQGWYVNPAKRAGATTLLLDHTPYEASRPRGSGHKSNAAKIVFAFEVKEDERPTREQIGYVTVTCTKNNLCRAGRLGEDVGGAPHGSGAYLSGRARSLG
jgi:integrase